MSETDSTHREQQESTPDRTRSVPSAEHDLIVSDQEDRPAAIVTITPIAEHGMPVADGLVDAIENAYGPLVEER